VTRPYLFVIPDAEASMSGGNIYNLGLTSALRSAGVDVKVVDRRGERGDGLCFVDSLYIDDVPRFAPCHLLAHYLPALVEGRDVLSASERAALIAVDGFVAPSAFMADALARLAPEPRPLVVVAPGIEIDHAERARTSRAVLVANLVPGKCVLPFLRALAPARVALAVVGSLERDPAYAAACRAADSTVAFLGELSHAETLSQIAASDFLVSSSRMESFGLALAEARALGVPIVARAGGNARAHVDEAAGGCRCDTDEALAAECVRLARDRVELDRRRRAALAHRPPTRTWADAARDFRAAFSDSIL
jgi:glycosyltransferase involved in cell wall biosynthesis